MASALHSDIGSSHLLASAARQRAGMLILALFLAAGTLALYEPSLHNGFIDYDDLHYITANVHVRHGLSWNNVKWAFTATEQANWHPLTWIALMTNEQVFGLKPAGYHLVNLLLHVLNVLLLFLLLQRATGYHLRSAIVAGLFAVFPLNVEAVAWAVEIKSVLSSAFLLLTLFAYGWYVRRPSLARYIPLAVLYAFGLMAKSMMITLPFALLLLDYWPLDRITLPERNSVSTPSFGPQLLHLIVEKIPLLALAAADMLLEVRAASQGSALSSYSSRAPLVLHVENSLWSYLDYILKGIWPSHLAIIYPFPDRLLPLWKVLTAGLVLLAISALVWHYRQRRYLLTGWLWYLGILVPVIGIVQSGPQAMADRWAYVPFLGIFVMVVWLGAEIAARTRLPRAATIALPVAIFAAYAWVSHIQIGYWRNSYTVFSHALEVTTANGVADVELAFFLREEGRPNLAMQHLRAAVREMPYLPAAHANLAALMEEENQTDEAIAEYKIAIACTHDPAEAGRMHNDLGALYLKTNDTPNALAEFDAAIQLNPAEVYALLNRGMFEYKHGQLEAAKQDLVRCVKLVPAPMTWYTLGRILEDQRDLQSAAYAYQTALRMAPDLSDARTRLDAVRREAVQ